MPERRSTTAIARRLLLITGLFGLLFGIGFLRNPDLFLHPALAVDDARHFRDYYNSLGEDRIFYHVSIGYLIVVPQLLAYASVNLLDVRQVPYAFALSSLLLLTAAYLVFLLPGFRSVFPRFGTRVCIAAAMALLPGGSYALISTIGFLNWTCLFAAIALSLLPPPKSPLWMGLSLAVISLCIWSNPTCIAMAVPLFVNVVGSWRRNDLESAAYFGFLLFVVLAYLPIGIHPDVWSGANTESLSAGLSAGLFDTLQLFFRSLHFSLDRVVVETLLGYEARIFLIEHGADGLGLALGVGAVVTVVHACWRNRRDRAALRMVLTLTYYIVAIGTASLAARADWSEVLLSERAFRYCYVQKYLWLLLLFVAYQPRLSALLEGGRQRVAIASLIAVLLYLAALSFVNDTPYKTELVSRNVEAVAGSPSEYLPEEARKLADFLAQVKRTEESLAEGDEKRMKLVRRRYPIELTVRPR